MIEYFLTLVVYVVLTFLSLKSFLNKTSYRASVSSMSIFLGFSLYAIDSIISIYQLYTGNDVRLNYIAVNFDIVGTLCLFFAATKIKGIHTKINNLFRIKILNLLFFILSLLYILIFNYNYIYSIDYGVLEPMLFIDPKLNMIYFIEILTLLILILIHIPFVKFYKFINLALIGFILKYFFKLLNEINNFNYSNEIELILSIIFTTILLASARKIYFDSYKLSK